MTEKPVYTLEASVDHVSEKVVNGKRCELYGKYERMNVKLAAAVFGVHSDSRETRDHGQDKGRAG